MYLEDTTDSIDPLVGLSPRLLKLFAEITWATRQRSAAQNLHTILWQLKQEVSVEIPDRRQKMLKAVATAYWRTAQIYFLCRYLRSVVIIGYDCN